MTENKVPAYFMSEEDIKKENKDTSTDMGVDFSFFTKPDANFVIDGVSSTPSSTTQPKKRGRPPKKKVLSDGSEIVLADESSDTELQPYQSNEPYINTYNETNFMLKSAIAQTDTLINDVASDIGLIRSSKTLKNKYRYITDLTGTESGLLSTKVNAVKELNNTITQCHNLELKKMKELQLGKEAEQTDDRRIQDLYNAFINTPVGAYGQPAAALAPSIQEMTLMSGIENMVRADINGGGMDAGYSAYVNNLSPEQNRMRLESNPNIQTVVVFNQETGQRWFDVIDKSTGQSVPNISRPDNFLLEDTTINVNTMTARNINIDQTYPLVVVGNNSSIMEY